MPQAVFDVVVSDQLFARLPFSVDQRSSRTSGLIMLVLLVPALITLILTVGLLTAFATPLFSIAADNPAAASQVLVGLGLWTVLFGIPAKRVILRFGRGRRIYIDGGLVTVRESGTLRAQVWDRAARRVRGPCPPRARQLVGTAARTDPSAP